MRMEGGVLRMGRPPKPVSVIEAEGKSHRTKAELEHRKKAEASLMTGIALKEWQEVKDNLIAHKEFMRVVKLLKVIGKNDDLHASVINRYCLLRAETYEFEDKREYFYKKMVELDELEDIDSAERLKIQMGLSSNIIKMDQQVMNKRKMMFDIEKENLMTIAGALRSIPKNPVDDEGDENADLFD